MHSKDSTKLAGALAFCAVFATCTLLAVTVFDKPGHIADHGKNVRMEQKADNNGSAPDMDAQKRPDSTNEGNDRRDFRNHRNFKDNNDSRNGETPGDKKSSSSDNSSDEDANSTDENKSDNKSQSDDNADSGKKNRSFKDNMPDSQNAPIENPNDKRFDNSKTTNLA